MDNVSKEISIWNLKIGQWTAFTVIIMFNSYFKPMDNGSMITPPMVGVDIY